jgi:hypothetical protein
MIFSPLPQSGAVTMPRRDPAKALQMLDSLAEFFDNGRRWLKGDWHDDDGNRCLISAMYHLRAVMNLYGDGTGYYLRMAQPEMTRQRIEYFNDEAASYDEIRALIDRARTLAESDRDKGPKLQVVEKPPAPRKIRARQAEPSDHPYGILPFATYGWKAKAEAILRADIERERAMRAAAGDTRPTWISLPRVPVPERLAA